MSLFDRDGDATDYPLTSPQIGVWLDGASRSSGVAYNVCEVIVCEGVVDADAFRRAVAIAESECDCFQMVVRVIDGVPRNVPAPSRPEYAFVDLTSTDDPERLAMVEAEMAMARPFDCSREAPSRHRLLRLAPDLHWWVRAHHHLAIDGFGGIVLGDRVCDIYNALIHGEAPTSSPLGRYRDFIAADAAYPASEQHARDLAYWRGRLDGQGAPSRFAPAPAVKGPACRHLQPLAAGRFARLEATARTLGASPASFLLAAYLLLLGRSAGTSIPVCATPLLNRLGRVERATVGMFTTMVPFHANLEQAETFADLGSQVARRLRADCRHMRMGAAHMRTAGLDPWRSRIALPPSFNPLDFPRHLPLENVRASVMTLANGPIDDVALFFSRSERRPAEAGTMLHWIYDSGAHDSAGVARLAERFEAILAAAAEDPQRRLADFPALGERDATDGRTTACSAPSSMAAVNRPIDLPSEARPAEFAGPGTTTYEAPATATEQRLGDLWKDLIDVPRVGRHDDFFALGGHSLLLMQLVSSLPRAGLGQPDLSAVMGATTLADMAALIDGAAIAPAAAMVAEEGAAAASPAQEAIWLARRDRPSDVVYSIQFPLPLESGSDPAVVRRALAWMAQRQESLRTVLFEREGRLYQQPLASADPEFSVQDCTADPEAAPKRLAQEELARPFDLGTGPVARFHLCLRGAPGDVLLCTIDHLVFDGLSAAILRSELKVALEAMAAGRTPILPPLPASPRGLAARRRKMLGGPRRDVLEAFWRPRVAADGAEPLPTDGAETSGVEGRRAIVRLEAATVAALRRLGVRAHATPTAVWAAAVAALLGRYKGGAVTLGMPFSGRVEPESEKLIGCFATVLPVRLAVGRGNPFGALVSTAGAELRAVMAHQDYPPEELRRLAAAGGRDSLFDAVAVIESSPFAPTDILDPNLGAGKFPLMFTLTRVAADRAFLVVEHDARRFLPERVARMADHLQRLIVEAERRPDAALGALPIMSEEEKALVVTGFNGTDRPYPRDASLAGLFRAAAARHGERPALVHADTALTYAALDRHSDALAAGLAAEGVIAGEVVGLAFARAPAAVVATLGVIKAGCAYLPLDPGLPPAMARQLMEDAGARWVIADKPGRRRLKSSGLAVLGADALARAGKVLPVPADDRRGGDAAYVMFTSGTTGEPKGVVVPHRAVARLVVNADFLALEPDDAMAQAAPLGFDAATLEIWAPLLAGARLVFLDDDVVLDPSRLAATLSESGVTVMWLTASLFNHVADERPQTFRGLRQLMTGGEALSPPHVRKVMDACPGLRLVNGYGPTENTTFTTTHTIARAEADGLSLPIGRPVANTRVLVLDAAGEPVPIGVWGELCAAGDGLAIGYTGRDDLTARAFASWMDERIYRTGDVVRWRADGVIEFAGRRDGQVKVRGHRIETAAIEAALSAQAGIRDAAVLAVGEGEARTLVACVVCEAPAEEAWRAALAGMLPDFMVPSRFLAVPRMPVSSNGKKDRAALADLVAEAGAPEVAGRPAETVAERAVARLFSTLFGDARIDADSDFFRLGGHSLLAMRLSGLIEKETGIRPAIRDLIAGRTVAGIARLIERGGGPVGLLPRASGPDYALSSGQARLWVLQRLHPDSPAYNVPIVLDLAGSLNRPALERALTALEERQHALRLRLRSAPDDPVGMRQHLAEPGGLGLAVTDVSAAADPLDAADALTAGEVARPFRLEEEAPARAHLVVLGAETWRLIIVLHHGACDGWSMPVLLRDLAALYAREAGAEAPTLPALARGYEDFAEWQQAFLAGPEGRALVERWRNRLLPLPEPMALPADRRRPPVKRFGGAFRLFAFDAATTERLVSLAQAAQATPFMVAVSLVQALLHRHTGQNDIALGTLVAGRDRAELVDLVGFFVNTLVLRQRVDPKAPFADLLAATRETCLAAMADQDCPFEALVDAVGVARDTSRNPLFDVLVAWQDSLPEPPALPGLSARFAEPPFPYAKFDLGFHFERDGDRIRAAVEYDTDLFDGESIDALLRRLEVLAGAAFADPGRTVEDLPVMTPEEQSLVVDGFNATQIALPVRRTVPQPFLEQVDAAGSAPAVLTEAETLTYAEFADRAASIAERLREAGARPGDVVALCARRSADMLAGIHGILLAGAAYAPLDPDHPERRRADMLEDLGDPLILAAPAFRPLFAGRPVVDLVPGRPPETVRNDAADPNGLAYVIFTSGSTGRPKGAAIEHHAVLNRILWMQREFPIGPGDVILQKTPVTFDVSVWELFWWSWTGAAVALPPPGAEKNPAALVDAVERFGVTVMHFVPSMLAAFLGWLESGQADSARLRSLRYVFASGEALDARLVERFNRLLYEPFGTELHNLYGPTEATVDVTWQPCSPWPGGEAVPIGRPIANTRIYVLDREGRPVPPGCAGEIHLGGPQVARGYVNRPDLTRERFVPDPFVAGGRLYRTGDLGRWRHDGVVEYLGRMDFQVKVRGFRIECGEIELALESHAAVERAIVVPAQAGGLTELHAYVTGAGDIESAALRTHLRDRVPEYMVPARFFRLDRLPVTSSGKVDRKALKGRPLDDTAAAAPASPVESRLLELWKELLPAADIGTREGFFDAGGNSLLVIRLHERLERQWPGVFTVADLFAHPTIAEQARRIAEAGVRPPAEAAVPLETAAGPVAIVGMAVRLAGFEDLQSFWNDLAGAADRVRPLPQSRAAEARALLSAMGRTAPARFREAAYLDDIYGFDPARFRMAPMDAALLDPEQRLFLEVATLALEDAGYGGGALDGARVGVFVGGAPTPAYREALSRLFPERAEQVFALNVPSNIATRLSFLKDWRGPAALVDTACSSALAAVHLACRALANGECEAALVGAARVLPAPPDADSRLTIDSSTARTRAFAEGADGTGMGEGGIAFLLKPLVRAHADGDAVRAVILGSAINQDGASSGLAAPNPAAQAEVVRAAASAAGIGLGSLSYIEAHGTGTALGDPIEVAGLTRAFAPDTAETGFAAIGSVKGNYGHLDGAAGALGLAKAVLCLEHDMAPPQPFFAAPNPKIDFARAPVAVPQVPMPLADRGGPRRAGVSAFGLSGINAHVIIEAPPAAAAEDPEAPWCVVGLSTLTADQLRRHAAAVRDALLRDPARLADVARTLAEGRPHLRHRLAVCASDLPGLLAALAEFATTGRGLLGEVGAAHGRAAPVVPAHASSEPDARVAANAYLAGASLSWGEAPARRIHLPSTPFNRIPCVPDFAHPTGAPPQEGGLLGPAVATREGLAIALDVHAPTFWPAAEHVLEGRPTLVGMALPGLFAEAAKAAGIPGTVELRGVRWLRPLRPDAVMPGTAVIELRPAEGSHQATLGGRSRGDEGGERWLAFAEALLFPAAEAPTPVDPAALQARCAHALPVQPFSETYGAVRVSARWDCRVAAWAAAGGAEILARLTVPADDQPFHPAVLDMAASLALDGEGRVPAGCETMLLAAAMPGEVMVHMVRRGEPGGSLEADITVFDPADGRVCVAVRGLRLVAVQAARTHLSIPTWIECPLAAPERPARILLVGGGALADRLAEDLARAGLFAGRASTAEAALAHPDCTEVVLAADFAADVFAAAANVLRDFMTGARRPMRVLAVGEGAYHHAGDGPAAMPEAALVAGLVLAVRHEEPLVQLRYLDLEPGTPAEAVAAEFAAFAQPDPVPVAILRRGRRYVRGFAPTSDLPAGRGWPSSGCCVVSGGLGGIALALAEEFAAAGGVSLALIGRSGRIEGDGAEARLRRDRLAALEQAGFRLRTYGCDVTDGVALAACLAQVRTDLGPITAVVHAAGVPDGGFLVTRQAGALAAVLAPKVEGARNLDLLTCEDPVEAFVLFGSLTGLVGAPGQAAYAAANAWLDAFAAWRRGQGRPALAIDWCAVSRVGMAARLATPVDAATTISPAEATAVWRRAIAVDAPQLAVVDPSVVAGPAPAPHPVAAPAPQPAKPAAGALEQALAAIWAKELGYPSVAPDDDFFALGGDSISGMLIVDQVVRDLGHAATLSDLMEAGTVAALAMVLRGKSAPADGPEPAPFLPDYPVAFEQAAVLNAEAAIGTGTAYNLPNLLVLPAEIDVAALEATLTALVAHHDILRTRFLRKGESWRMEILPPSPVRLPVVDLRGEADLLAAAADRARPFDLLQEPPVRFELLLLDGERRALFFDIHHALADGLTIEILAGEIARLHAGEALEPLALQLKDFAWWSREGAGKAARDTAREYWLSRFTNRLPLIDLPADWRRPAVNTWRAATVSTELASDTVRALRGFASRHRTTPFAVVLTAWMALIHRLSGTEDVVISVPADRRDDAGFAGVPGMMVSLLPIRETVRGADSVEALLKRVQADHAEALRHRAYGLGQLLQDLALPASPDRTLLSEVTLSYMNFAEASDGGSGFAIQGVVRRSAKNDLSIFMRDLPDRIAISLEYYADLFDQARIEGLGRSFATLLAGLVSAPPETPVDALPLLSAEEEALVRLFEAGGTPELPAGQGLYDLVLAQSAARCDAVAVEDSGLVLTYGELVRRANGIAAGLVEAGVRPGDRVALHMTRDAQAVAAVLGIVAAGAAYVPLDPSYPAEHMAMTLDDAACRAVIADAPGRAAVAAVAGIPVLESEALAGRSAYVPPPLLGDDPGGRPAYLMYTSGSTGLPKGVLVPQRAVIRLAVGDDYVRLGAQDRILQAGPLAFDASTFEIWGPLLNGGRICVASREELLDPAGLAAAIRRFGITVLWLTASLFNRQVEHDPASFRGLRALLTGGEVMSVAHMRRACQACPDVAFFNGYGPTENTTFTTVHPVQTQDLDMPAMPIGRPVPNTRVTVLDGSGQRTPIGVWGEIHAGGPGLATGYWNRPELTAAAFVKDPERPGERLYRTGDLGRWRTDGVLEYGGRRDNQVKLRGYRIELDEIEQVLHRHPLAERAAVLFRQDEQEGSIVACLQAAAGPVPVAELRSWLAARLPAYMVPSRWYALADIPLSMSGKVDRQRLIEMLADCEPLREDGEEDGAPADDVERTVAAILSEVLGQPVDRRRANFLDLGGHSLQAIRVVNRVAERTGVRITMAEFFADPTVCGLAGRVAAMGTQALPETIPPAPPAAVHPASHGQQRLYLLHDMDRGSGAYNMTFAFRCDDRLDTAVLARTLRRLALRHETLCTGFEVVEGAIVQRVVSDAEPAVAEDDVSGRADAAAEALRIARREVAAPFDLARPPLLRARVIRLAADDVLLLLVLHHIVGDGWSSRILAREVAALYAAERDGIEAMLAPLPIAYKDFATWQRSRDWSSSAAFWRQRLDGAPESIALPADRPLPEVQSYRGATCRTFLPSDVAAALHALARECRVTMSAVGLALFAALLYRLTRQGDMVVGMGVAGRDRIEVEGLIGFFVNVLPVRLRLDDDTELDGLIAQAHGAIVEAMDHRDYPFDLLVREAAPRRQANRQPIVNVVFEYQHFGALDAGEADALPLRQAVPDDIDREVGALIHSATAKHDLLFFFIDGEDGAEIVMEYDTDILEAATAERWLGHFVGFASAVASSHGKGGHGR